MVPSKRPSGVQGDDESDVPRRDQRQRLVLPSIFGDFTSRSLHEFVPILEPFLRSVVRDEVDLTIQRVYHSSPRSVSRVWQLNFQNKLPSILFTCTKIGSVGGDPIKVVLVDPTSKATITSGPLSSMKIEIVVLNGDFVADERENWTEEDFNRCIIREREGKRPLVTGDLIITLKDGVADVDNVCFTDNSCWIKCRKFRLGARPQGSSNEVREAKSEAFVVKDHRGESYKKHHPPFLADDVWRLEKIAKDGASHKRLVALAGISTVKEFLRLYVTDPSWLRKVIGGDNGISNKIWDTIIEHATTCVLDDKMYLYTEVAQRVVLLFNSIWMVIGASFSGHNYQALDTLSFSQMRLVEEVTQQAYKNLGDLVLFNERPYGGDPAAILSNLQAKPFCSFSANVSDGPNADQGCDQMTTSAPYAFEVANGSQIYNCHSSQEFLPTLENRFKMKDSIFRFYNEGYGATSSGSLGSVLLTGDQADDNISEAQTSTQQRNGFFLASGSQSSSRCL